MIINLKNEVWKPVLGYEGKYELSNFGRIKSLSYLGHNKTKLLKTHIIYGYEVVKLWKKDILQNCRVHRLVYEAFNGKLPKWTANGSGDKIMEINHINEIKTDNRLENLELVTRTQNIRHSKIKIAKAHFKKVYQYTINGDLVRTYDSIKSCNDYGFNDASVCRCCKNLFGKAKNIYKGFIWSYVPLENVN